jgi:hypothetical protein
MDSGFELRTVRMYGRNLYLPGRQVERTLHRGRPCTRQVGVSVLPELVQEPVDPQIIDKGMPTAGLVAHTLVGRFIDHLPYYRLEQINARSGVVTPRSTLASWSGAAGAALAPLYDAHRAFILGTRVLHADETPVSLLNPGAGKTRKAYVWAYARGVFDKIPGVVYDFCIAGRRDIRSRSAVGGTARSSATTTAPTMLSSSSKIASRQAVWRMQGGGSTNCSKPVRVRSPRRRCSALLRCTASSRRSPNSRRTSATRCALSEAGRCGTRCTPG